MNSIAFDKRILSGLDPLEIVAYLRSRGWLQNRSVSGKYSRWVADGVEVDVPANNDFVDYASRVADILSTLSKVENRSYDAIYSDLSISTADVIRFRLVSSSMADGTISLEDGAKIISKAKDLLLAAACAAVEPKSIYHSRRPLQATEYIQKLRMGQTERGSFVFTAISIVPPALAPTEEEPFERQATLSLSRSLFAISKAAEIASQENRFDPFQEAVKDGVSLNLCESLADLHSGAEPKHNIDIRLSWASHRPAPSTAPTSFTFQPGHLQVIGEAARVFRRTAPYDFILRGIVTRLERTESNQSGIVTILALINEKYRHVSVALPEAEYLQALEAHAYRRIVSLTGVLQVESKRCELKSPTNFKVEKS
jgi:hypothetical protein